MQMTIWDIIFYISAGIVYAAAGATIIGWINHARKGKEKDNREGVNI